MTSTPDRELGDFEGHTIGQTAMSILKASAAVNQSLTTDPAIYHHGDRAVIVLEGPIIDIRHPFITNTQLVRRIHTMTAELATPIDRDLVADMLEAQRARNLEREGAEKLARKRAKDETEGTPELDGMPNDAPAYVDDAEISPFEEEFLTRSDRAIVDIIPTMGPDTVDQLRRLLSIERHRTARPKVIDAMVARITELTEDREGPAGPVGGATVEERELLAGNVASIELAVQGYGGTRRADLDRLLALEIAGKDRIGATTAILHRINELDRPAEGDE